MITNGAVAGSTGWILVRGAFYEPSVSTAPESGSLDISAVGNPVSAGTSAQVQSARFPVEAGVTYTLAYSIRATVAPVGLHGLIGVYNASGTFLYNRQVVVPGPTQPDEWSRFEMTYTPQPGEAFLRVMIGRKDKPGHRNDGQVWADDFFAGAESGS
jgi:hypothetical protein